MTRLQIQNRRERLMVRAADAMLAPLGWLPQRVTDVRRVLLLRLERIGDLLMTVEAIADVKRAWPNARIHLAVGSWNASIARLIADIDHVHVLDVPWLSRGEAPASWRAIVRQARGWRQLDYDLALNFEPDIRSNLLMWLSGAHARIGYMSGGGAGLLSTATAYDPSRHVSDNARRLVALAAGSGDPPRDTAGFPRIRPTPAHVSSVADSLGPVTTPLIGIHVSGGRASKQWHPARFADVARALASLTGATIVFTGGKSDRPLVDEVAASLDGVAVKDMAGAFDLPETAALLGRLDLFITGDTGPMHLAGAMGTPVVALFGPSDPVRYGPRARVERILRVQLPCSPCGQVRLPPVRCRGHVPDCMDGITVDTVVAAALDALADARAARDLPA